MIGIYSGGEDCQKCGGTKPLKIECPWCAIKTLESERDSAIVRVKKLERELLAYQGERALLKQEIESLRRNDPYLNRE